MYEQDGNGACNIPGATYWVLSARLRRKAFFIIDCRRPNSGGGAMIATGQSTFHEQISCKIFLFRPYYYMLRIFISILSSINLLSPIKIFRIMEHGTNKTFQ